MKFKSIGKLMAGAAVGALLVFSLAGCGSSGASSASSAALSGTVSTNGSTSMERVIGSLSEAFMAENSGVSIAYDATGSGTGIECAKNKTCDMGLASRNLKESETGLKAVTVGLDGIAVIVSADSQISDLTLAQVTDIFTGKITNWSQVGGADLEISCIGRENGSGTRDGFESITKTADSCKLDQELTSTGAVITAVSSSKNAIGYASLSSVEGKTGVKSVTIDGVACSEKTVLDGSYKIQRPFNFVIAEDAELSPAAQAFVDFSTSANAADLIREAGAVPVVK